MKGTLRINIHALATKAVADVLGLHSLPESDAAAVSTAIAFQRLILGAALLTLSRASRSQSA